MGILNSNNNSKELDDLKSKIADLESQLDGKPKQIEQLKVLYTWTSPERIFVARDKPWFLKISIVFLIIILILAFMGQLVLIILCIALMMLIFALASFPPMEVTHEITNKGIRTIGKLYTWSELSSFWFSRKYDFAILNVDTKLNFPARLLLLLPYKRMKMAGEVEAIYSSEIEDIKTVLGNYLEMKISEDDNKKQGRISKLTEGEIIK